MPVVREFQSEEHGEEHGGNLQLQHHGIKLIQDRQVPEEGVRPEEVRDQPEAAEQGPRDAADAEEEVRHLEQFGGEGEFRSLQ